MDAKVTCFLLPFAETVHTGPLALLLAASDPAAGVGLLTALVAGIVSFLSPCVLPIVPGYLSAVSGVQVSDLDRADWRKVLVPSLIFCASFSTVFILLGMGATKIGSLLSDHRDLLDKIAADIENKQAPLSAVADLHRDAIHMKLDSGRYLMHNAMRHALGQEPSTAGFEALDPELKKYLDKVLATLPQP